MLAAYTQAILLLCANFGQNRPTEPSPFTLSEYNSLASWLRQQELTPADWLDRSLQEKLPDITIARTGFWASFFPTQSGFFAGINPRKMAKPRTMDYRTGRGYLSSKSQTET